VSDDVGDQLRGDGLHVPDVLPDDPQVFEEPTSELAGGGDIGPSSGRSRERLRIIKAAPGEGGLDGRDTRQCPRDGFLSYYSTSPPAS